MIACDVLDDVFVQQHLVGHTGQTRIAHVDLRLTGGADFEMMQLNLNAHFFQGQDHLRADILHMIHRRHRQITFLVARLVSQVLF